MIKKLFLLALSVIIFSVVTNAQSNAPCGTKDFHLVKEQFLKNRAYAETHKVGERSITYVPLKFHIIGKADGSGAVEETEVLDMLCCLNDFYAPMDIKFYIKDGFAYFNNTTVATDPRSNAGTLQMINKKVKNVVNVFLVQSFVQPGLLGYYIPTADFLVVKRSEVRCGKQTIEHELGHYFTLPHPFNGWEDNDYDPAIHGNPVSSKFAPGNSSKSPFGPVLVELQDKSNCANAGDFICDTPPSYNFYNSYHTPCTDIPFAKAVKDPNGDIVFPNPNNVMDYNSNCSTYEFSLQQQGIIKADLTSRIATSSARKLVTSYTPFPTVTDNVQLTFPSSGQTLETFGLTTLDWENVPNAGQYYVIISNSTSFSLGSPFTKFTIVTESKWDVTTVKGVQYYFKVIPIVESSFCPPTISVNTFTAGQWTVSTTNIKELSSLNLQENPVPQGQDLLVNLENGETFQANVYVTDLTGRNVYTRLNNVFNQGTSQLAISTDAMTSGMYIITMKSGSGINSMKFTVQ